MLPSQEIFLLNYLPYVAREIHYMIFLYSANRQFGILFVPCNCTIHQC